MRSLRIVSYSVTILVTSAAYLSATTVIDLGSFDLFPNQDGQAIDIVATVPAGSTADHVTGLNLRVRIGDGLGPLVEPTFSLTAADGRGVDFSGAIWNVLPTIIAGNVVDDAPQFLQASVVFNAAATTVPAVGRIATIYIDTTGIEEGSFDLQLAMTGEIGLPTEFIQPGVGSVEPLSVTIFDGTLNVVPEPTAAMLAVLGVLGLWRFRRVRR